MDATLLFTTLQQQYAKKLPFVVYSRPINSIINCWLQEDDALHKTETFTESGFVFSPFNLDEKSILFPKVNCEFFEIESDQIDVDMAESFGFVQNEKDKIQHLKLVEKGIETIRKHELQKIVLSRCETKSIQIKNPFIIFKRLFNAYKNAMVYCWFHPKVGLWIGATPELLFKVEGKQLTTISLAGTLPFIKNKMVNWSAKETEEQQIVTDYITQQIKPYTKSIFVSEVETVRAGNLLHLKTRIKSVIKDEAELKLIMEALHPTPAVCGFPKLKAKTFILKNEHYNREYYTGFLGELNLKKASTRNTNRRNVENNAYSVVKTQSNFYVNLRCIQIKDDNALLYVGGGITKDSIPANEWEETVNKTKTMRSVLE